MDVPSVIENSEGGMGISLLTWNNRNDIYIPGRNNKKIRQMCKTLVFKTLNIRQ